MSRWSPDLRNASKAVVMAAMPLAATMAASVCSRAAMCAPRACDKHEHEPHEALHSGPELQRARQEPALSMSVSCMRHCTGLNLIQEDQPCGLDHYCSEYIGHCHTQPRPERGRYCFGIWAALHCRPRMTCSCPVRPRSRCQDCAPPPLLLLPVCGDLRIEDLKLSEDTIESLAMVHTVDHGVG